MPPAGRTGLPSQRTAPHLFSQRIMGRLLPSLVLVGTSRHTWRHARVSLILASVAVTPASVPRDLLPVLRDQVNLHEHRTRHHQRQQALEIDDDLLASETAQLFTTSGSRHLSSTLIFLRPRPLSVSSPCLRYASYARSTHR